MTDVIIIGAGPYGLSLAAHLRASGVPYRIFGRVMSNWREKMPAGMLLKSDPFASNLVDPNGALPLREYCRAQGIPYDDEAIRVSVETFIAYGEVFQRRFVPDVEQHMVVALDRTADGFTARLDDGEVVIGQRAVIAVGISDFPFIPAELGFIPREFMSHAADHADMTALRGREVAIIGAGSSAVDLAALLHENGASVRMVFRRPDLRFHGRAELGPVRSLGQRLGAPNTGIGPGWRNVFFTETPQLFRYLPRDLRQGQVEKTHGPAGGWFMRDRVVDKVPFIAGVAPVAAEARGGRLHLLLAGPAGDQTIAVDHVIACTGYRVDIDRISFLSEQLRGRIGRIAKAPELSAHFETSVRGLHVIGPAAAYSFGPVCRFVVGAEFTTPRIARYLTASASRRPVVQGATAAAGR